MNPAEACHLKAIHARVDGTIAITVTNTFIHIFVIGAARLSGLRQRGQAVQCSGAIAVVPSERLMLLTPISVAFAGMQTESRDVI